MRLFRPKKKTLILAAALTLGAGVATVTDSISNLLKSSNSPQAAQVDKVLKEQTKKEVKGEAGKEETFAELMEAANFKPARKIKMMSTMVGWDGSVTPEVMKKHILQEIESVQKELKVIDQSVTEAALNLNKGKHLIQQGMLAIQKGDTVTAFRLFEEGITQLVYAKAKIRDAKEAIELTQLLEKEHERWVGTITIISPEQLGVWESTLSSVEEHVRSESKVQIEKVSGEMEHFVAKDREALGHLFWLAQ